MGCKPSKNLRSNLTTDQPSQTIGSTALQADQIVVLGDSVFLPTKSPDGESAILEISLSKKQISIYRGMANRAVRSGIA